MVYTPHTIHTQQKEALQHLIQAFIRMLLHAYRISQRDGQRGSFHPSSHQAVFSLPAPTPHPPPPTPAALWVNKLTAKHEQLF